MVLNPVLLHLQICLPVPKWVWASSCRRTEDFTDGTATNTGRGTDVAISQNGFFRMVDANGSVFYSHVASSSWTKTVTGEHAGDAINRLSGCRDAINGSSASPQPY